ncbi:MAG TPA: peptidylprolyl isomerase [Anaerolineae bacterium]|nr:peptidylprolyl isomerase [Anaerolineae bacterium]
MAKRRKPRVQENGPTPKEIVRRRRERQQNRNLFIGLGAVAVLIIGLLATALIQEFALEPGSPVAIVEGVKIRTNDFQKRSRFEYDNALRQLNQYLQLDLQFSSGDQGGVGLFDQQIEQLQSLLQNPDLLSLDVLDRMVQEELIRQAAVEQGLLVTETEIDADAERQFGFVRNPTPTPVVTPAVITSTQVITGSDGVTTTEVTSATATPRPTVDLMTEEEYQEDYASTMEQFSENLRFSEADFRDLIETRLLEEKLRERIGEQVPTTEEQVRARHILFGPDTEIEDQQVALEQAGAEAQEAYERLLAGEDFAALALELSDDPGSGQEGGDLGWFGRGQMVPEFDAVAFSLALEEISEPFTSTFGYHIVQVLERDPQHELDESILSQSRSQGFDDWLAERQQTANIERFWSEDKVPPTPTQVTQPVQ